MRVTLKSGIIACMCMLLALCLFVWWGTRVTRGNNGDIVLYGNVDIRQVDVGFRVAGRIAEVLVDEGQRVAKGDVLARLDSDMLTQARDQAAANLAGQKAQLALLEKGYRKEEVAQAQALVRETQAQAENTRRELQRITALRKSNAVSQKNLDDARAQATAADARLRSAQDNLQMLTSGFREEDILQQQAAVASATAQLALAETRLKDAVLIAPQHGVVLTRAREVGAIVQEGQPVYSLSLVDPVWIRAYVEQTQLGLVKPGMTVKVRVDAMPKKNYRGTVGFVSPTAEFTPKTVETADVRAALVYRIRIQAEDPDNVMRQGMPVTIEVPLSAGTE